MSLRDICLPIAVNETLDLSGDNFNNTNKLINFVDGWYPPYIYSLSNSQVCGPFAKIIEQLSIQFGYK